MSIILIARFRMKFSAQLQADSSGKITIIEDVVHKRDKVNETRLKSKESSKFL